MKYPLRYTIPGALLIFTIILAMWSLEINGRIALNRVEKDMSSKLINILTQLQESVEHELRMNNLARVQKVISGFGSNDHLKALFLVDEAGEVVGGTRFSNIGLHMKSFLSTKEQGDIEKRLEAVKTKYSGIVFPSPDRNSLWGIYPVQMGYEEGDIRPTRTGALIAEVDLITPRAVALGLVENQVYQFCLFIGALVVGLGVFFHFQMTRRIQKLVAATEAFAAGDFQVQIDVGGRDELTDLAESMTDMVKKRNRAKEEKKKWDAHYRQQQKLESIGLLAGGVAHEINNPINGIMNYAQLIQDRMDPNDPLHEFSSEIIHETERVANIIKNLLSFARQDKEAHSPANVNDIVEGTLSLIRTIIRRDQITLEVDVPDDLPLVKCRSQQVQQVLMNLLTNARDALNERYPEHDLDKIIRVTAQLFREGEWVRITVEDHGQGMSEDIKEHIFDPFFTTKDRTKGTGMGLAISYGIVKEHYGELSVETETGKYTKFHIDLRINNGWSVESKSDQDGGN